MSINSFKIDKSLELRPQASPPVNPTVGEIYNDEATNKLMVYNGSSWVDLGSGGGGGGGGGGDALNLFIDGSFESGNSDFTITSGTGSLTIETADVVISPGNQQALSMTLNSSANAEASFVITEEYTEKVCLFKGWYKAPLATYTGQISLQIAGSTSGTLRTKALPQADEWTPFFMLFKVGTLTTSETLTITFDSSAPSGSQTILLDLLSVGVLNEPVTKYVYPVIRMGNGRHAWSSPGTYDFAYIEMAAGSGGGGGGRGAASGNLNTGGGAGAAGGSLTITGSLSVTMNGGAGGAGAPGQSGAAATAGGDSPSNSPPSGSFLVGYLQGGRPGTSGVGGTNWYSPGAAAPGGTAWIYGLTTTLSSSASLTITVGAGGGGGGGGGNSNSGNRVGAAGSANGAGGSGATGSNSAGGAGGGGGGSCNAEDPGAAGGGATNGAAEAGYRGLAFSGSGGNASPGVSHTYGGGGGGGGGSGVCGLFNLYLSW